MKKNVPHVSRRIYVQVMDRYEGDQLRALEHVEREARRFGEKCQTPLVSELVKSECLRLMKVYRNLAFQLIYEIGYLDSDLRF